jgi:hypothetical protein
MFYVRCAEGAANNQKLCDPCASVVIYFLFNFFAWLYVKTPRNGIDRR